MRFFGIFNLKKETLYKVVEGIFHQISQNFQFEKTSIIYIKYFQISFFANV